MGGYASASEVGKYTDALILTPVGSTLLSNYSVVVNNGVLTIDPQPTTFFPSPSKAAAASLGSGGFASPTGSPAGVGMLVETTNLSGAPVGVSNLVVQTQAGAGSLPIGESSVSGVTARSCGGPRWQVNASGREASFNLSLDCGSGR